MTDIPSSLGQAIADAQRVYTEQYRDHDRAHRHDERMATLEHLEQESVTAIKETLMPLLDHLEIDPETKRILANALDPQQPVLLALLIPVLAAIGFWIGQAAGQGPASSIAQSSMRQWGSFTLDPVALMQAAIAGRIDPNHAYSRAQDSGMSTDKWTDLGYIVQTEAPPGVAQEAFQRRAIDIEGFQGALVRAGLSVDAREVYDKVKYDILDPTTILALWRLKRIDDPTAYEMLQHTGLSDTDAARVASLRWQPPDVGTIVNAATQNQLTRDQYNYLLEQKGIDPDYANVIFETSGETMPPDMANRLFREGRIDLAKYEEILTESRLKNKYVPLMKLLRFRPPPMRTAVKLYTDKVIERAKAQEYLEQDGFETQLASDILDGAEKHGTTSVKNLSPSTIEKLYGRGKYDRGTAEQMLESLGYDATEAGLLLDLVDDDKVHSAMDRAATSIGTRYTSWKIDRSEAVTLLDRINVPSSDRDELLEIWDARREAQTLHLSEAFLHKAFKAGKIDRGEVERRLLAMGYDAVDAKIVMDTDFPPTAAEIKAKDLSRADQVKRYTDGIITKPVLRTLLMGLGYDGTEADQIIELADKKLAETAASTAATNGA